MIVDAIQTVADAVRDLERAIRGEAWHGTVTGYTNHACRCDACKQAKAASWAAYKKRKGRAG